MLTFFFVHDTCKSNMSERKHGSLIYWDQPAHDDNRAQNVPVLSIFYPDGGENTTRQPNIQDVIEKQQKRA